MASRSEMQQAVLSTYAPRLRTYNNSLLAPVLPSAVPVNPLSRTTKRGTTVINYAEDGYDDYEDDDDDNRRRPTGLRSLRRDDSTAKGDPSEKVGKERPSLSRHKGYGASGWAKPQEITVPYRLRDTFLWNLHETLITTDQFAIQLVNDLDLPNRSQTTTEISKQIRTQLEEYAGVALHPLFHTHVNRTNATETVKAPHHLESSTPAPNTASISRADTPMGGNSNVPSTPSKLAAPPTPAAPAVVQTTTGEVTATATPIPPDADDFSPDDTYRCIINLNINLSSQIYTDKFEWSLLHPPGTAEAFAKQTCADLGLHGEWVPAMTHAIYEAVLKLKKEACESGGLVAGWSAGPGASGAVSEFPNDAAVSAAGDGAGWRYDPEHLADDWEPKLETLSKEEIEKREGDRERQIRRLRRETARFSSNTGMAGGVPVGFGFGGLIEQEEERMGRGERSKKKRRFRSLSPRSMTPGGGRFTPDVGGAGPAAGGGGGYGGGGTLAENERSLWRCAHCNVWGTSVWAVRDGPYGPRSLCNNCGFVFERDRKLPRWAKNLHVNDPKPF